MTTTGSDPAVALFEAVLAAPPERRSAILEEARRVTPALCAEVESLLDYHERSDPILGTPREGPLGAAIGEPGAPPARLGEFEIIARIGRGGMGDVYSARQRSPAREVALKIVRPELASPEMVARLQREAEVLGRLQHPGVAHVYQCGVAPDPSGRPRAFVVMELIKGRTLPEFLARAAPSRRERLELLARVCDAVDHAHRRGVIHRDLKPANILITDEPEPRPKVLDFGLACLRDVTDQAAVATIQGQVMGTLAYMSPEQAGGGDGGGPHGVDTRSDVYSLGAVLLEMLTGRTPVDTAGLTLSQALAAVAHAPRPRAGVLDPALRGDLDAIVARALEIDPARRYASAAEFAADIRRYLSGQSVLARPQTAVYQLRKLAGRNKPAAAALAALLLAIVGGAGVATWQAVRIGHERDRAESQARRARETAAFLRRLIQTATPERGGGKETTLRALLEEASTEFLNARGKIGDDPVVAVEVLTTLAAGYISLSEFGRAEGLARRATEVASASGVGSSEEGLRARITLAGALASLRRHDEGVAIATAAAGEAERLFGEGHPVHIDALRAVATAAIASNLGPGAQKAAPYARRAYELAQKVYAPDDERSIQALHVLARVERARTIKSSPEVDRLLRELVARNRAVRGDEHYRTLEAAQLLARYLQRAERFQECREVLEPLLPVARRVLPAEHNLLAHIEQNLGEALAALGESEPAVELFRSALAAFSKHFGNGDIESVLCRGYLITALIDLKRFDEAQAQIDLQAPVAAASGDAYFKANLGYQRFGVALGRGQIGEAERLAASLKGTHAEAWAAAKLARARPVR